MYINIFFAMEIRIPGFDFITEISEPHRKVKKYEK